MEVFSLKKIIITSAIFQIIITTCHKLCLSSSRLSFYEQCIIRKYVTLSVISDLCNRICLVRVRSGVSEVDTMTTGVPQGTVLEPLLFNACFAPLTTLLQKYNIHHHLYADDTQLYITFPQTDQTQALARMEACAQDAKAWLCDKGLVMNNNKSQAIVIRSSSLRTPVSRSRTSKVSSSCQKVSGSCQRLAVHGEG